ncbi:MAG TPA: hypothetical protein PKE06_22300 [Flavilitoribacter sp.]|nr:hypothetical protein [Flavilitoribacter sp.]HMQ88744.1 hypothetical protein [Flavilitoribacter sp.]
MYNSRLFHVIRRLETPELRKVDDFVRSPYFNKDKRVVDLWVYIRRFYPDLTHPGLDRKAVCRALFQQGEAAENKLRAYMSRLARLIEAYMEQETLQSWPALQDRLSVRTLRERGDHFFFSQEVERLGSRPEPGLVRTLDYFLEKWWLLHEAYFHSGSMKYDQDNQSLEELIDTADEAFVLLKLRYACETIQRRRRLGHHYPVRMLDEISAAAAFFAPRNPLIAIYRQLLGLSLDPADEAAYQVSHRLVTDHFQDLEDFDKAFSIKLLLSHIFKRINESNLQAGLEAWTLYALADKAGLISPDGRVESDVYLNVVVCACLAGKFDWCHRFIGKYGDHLPESEREYIVNIARAYWHYHQIGKGFSREEALEKASSLLADTHYLNTAADLRFRSLQLRVFYEYYNELFEETRMVLSAADSFEKYLRRTNQFPAVTRSAYLKFVQLLRKLVKLRAMGRSAGCKKVLQLRQTVHNTELVALKHWLLDKLELFRTKLDCPEGN